MYVQTLSMEALETLVDRQDTNTAATMILEERVKQLKKWGEQNHHPVKYLAILQEEVGELADQSLLVPGGELKYIAVCKDAAYIGGLAQDIVDSDFPPSDNPKPPASLLTEAIHTAAVALAIVEMLLRKGYTP